MKNYKVEINLEQVFAIDVMADNEEQAQENALMIFSELKDRGMEHHYQIGDTVWNAGTVYDVTNTDDPFNPEN